MAGPSRYTEIVIPEELLDKAGYETPVVVITCGAPCGCYLVVGSRDYQAAVVAANWGPAKIAGHGPEKWYCPHHVRALLAAVEAV